MGKLASIFRYLFRRQRVESDLDRELQYHVDRQMELNLKRGMSPAEARRQAALTVGGVEPLKDDCRDARVGRAIEILFQDIRYGVRVLTKNPGYSLAAILTLALGIGANTAIFSLVYGVFLRPLPYRDGGRLVVLRQTSGSVKSDALFSPIEIAAYTKNNHTMQGVVEHHEMSFLLIGKDTSERVQTSVVSVNFFDVLGVRALLGRTFLPSDDDRSSGAVLVMSYKYWQSHYRGDTSIVGRVFTMNDIPHTVIGVLPPVPQYPSETDVYMPTWQCPARSDPKNIANINFRLINTVFGRLKPGVSLAAVQADMEVILHQTEAAHPDGFEGAINFAVNTAPLDFELTKKARTPFLVLLGVAGFVLLIACANVANMMLARLLKLEKELAVRAALGAGRARLMHQLLTESVLVAFTGGAIGLATAPLALRVLVGFAERFTTRAAEVRIDWPVQIFALALSVATGLLFGLAPAFAHWDRVDSLHQGGRTTGSRGRQMLRGALVIAQVAVSFVLLIGAGLMMRSFAKIQQQNPGFDTSRLIAMRVSFPLFHVNTVEPLRNAAFDLLRRVREVSGVESAALCRTIPLYKTVLANGPDHTDFQIEGRPSASQAHAGPTVDTTIVDAGYFETVGQPLLSGRLLTEHDNDQAPLVAVINQTMARHQWPNQNPLGRRVTFDQGEHWLTIVGVVGDTREYGLDRPTFDELYVPMRQGGRFGSVLLVRTAGDPNRMLALVQTAIHRINPYIAFDRVDTLGHLEYESMASPRLMTIMLGLFAGLAVFISASGIAAVMALSVRQRSHELGIRMALGAARRSVIGMVVKQGLVLAAGGAIAGVAGAAVLARLLTALLYDTSPRDVTTFGAVSVLFLTVAAIACLIPALQVTAIDPLHALRRE